MLLINPKPVMHALMHAHTTHVPVTDIHGLPCWTDCLRPNYITGHQLTPLAHCHCYPLISVGHLGSA